MGRHLLLCGLLLAALTGAVAQGPAPEPGRPPVALPSPSPASPPGPPPTTPAEAERPTPAAHPAPPGVPALPSVDTLLAPLVAVPRMLGRPLIFVALFVFVGLVFRVLVRRVTAGSSGAARYGDVADERTARRAAIGDLLVWLGALAVAGRAVDLDWFAPLSALFTAVLHLVGSLLVGALWLAAAAMVAYAISSRGRDFVLGLAGWYYLTRGKQTDLAQREFDLGDGVRGRYVRTDCLHTVLQGSDGREHYVPNAWLMRKHFNWDEERFGGGPEAKTG